jgi:hypothetical protein
MRRADLLCLLVLLLLTGAAGAAEKPAFASPPAAVTAGGKATISFSVTAPCAAAVWIEDAEGKVVRRLAAGMLGPKAPSPFRKGLVQKIVWDGKNAKGKPVPAGCRVKVGLGLAHKFERAFGWDPKAIRKIYSVAVGPKGEVFILWATPYGVSDAPRVSVFDREGKYLRTIVPAPGSLPPAKMAALNPVKLTDGRVVPRTHHALASTFHPWLSGTQRQTMAVTSKGKLVLTTGYFNYSTVGSTGPRRLLTVGLDGSCPQDYLGPILDKRQFVRRSSGGEEGRRRGLDAASCRSSATPRSISCCPPSGPCARGPNCGAGARSSPAPRTSRGGRWRSRSASRAASRSPRTEADPSGSPTSWSYPPRAAPSWSTSHYRFAGKRQT